MTSRKWSGVGKLVLYALVIAAAVALSVAVEGAERTVSLVVFAAMLRTLLLLYRESAKWAEACVYD